MNLQTKHLLCGSLKNVKVVEASNRYDELEFDFEEEAKFLNIQGVFRTCNSENQDKNMDMIITMINRGIMSKEIGNVWITSGAIRPEHMCHP